MRQRLSGLNIGHVALGAGLFALLVAALILWLGNQSADDVLRLVAEGRVVQGEEAGTRYGDKNVTTTVAYVVDGKRYTTTSITSTGSRPVFDEDPIAVPRLGLEKPMQVVYLPAAPAIARLRDDLKEARTPVHLASGLFALIGLTLGGVGFAFRRSRRR